MPLYQMLCITKHYAQYSHIRELARQTCKHLLDEGSVVRSVDYWGTKELPGRMKRHGQPGEYHTIGDYWTLHFDTSPKTVSSLENLMRVDPRVLRWTVLKLAHKPEDIARWGSIIKKGSVLNVEDLH